MARVVRFYQIGAFALAKMIVIVCQACILACIPACILVIFTPLGASQKITVTTDFQFGTYGRVQPCDIVLSNIAKLEKLSNERILGMGRRKAQQRLAELATASLWDPSVTNWFSSKNLELEVGIARRRPIDGSAGTIKRLEEQNLIDRFRGRLRLIREAVIRQSSGLRKWDYLSPQLQAVAEAWNSPTGWAAFRQRREFAWPSSPPQFSDEFQRSLEATSGKWRRIEGADIELVEGWLREHSDNILLRSQLNAGELIKNYSKEVDGWMNLLDIRAEPYAILTINSINSSSVPYSLPYQPLDPLIGATLRFMILRLVHDSEAVVFRPRNLGSNDLVIARPEFQLLLHIERLNGVARVRMLDLHFMDEKSLERWLPPFERPSEFPIRQASGFTPSLTQKPKKFALSIFNPVFQLKPRELEPLDFGARTESLPLFIRESLERLSPDFSSNFSDSDLFRTSDIPEALEMMPELMQPEEWQRLIKDLSTIIKVATDRSDATDRLLMLMTEWRFIPKTAAEGPLLVDLVRKRADANSLLPFIEGETDLALLKPGIVYHARFRSIAGAEPRDQKVRFEEPAITYIRDNPRLNLMRVFRIGVVDEHARRRPGIKKIHRTRAMPFDYEMGVSGFDDRLGISRPRPSRVWIVEKNFRHWE